MRGCDFLGGFEEIVVSIFMFKFVNECIIFIKDLNFVVVIVVNNDFFFVINGDVCGVVKFFFVFFVGIKLRNIFFLRVKDLDLMVVVIGYVDIIFVVNCNIEWWFEFVFFVVVLVKLMECWVDVGVFLVVDDEYGEGIVYDWFILNGNRYFMFVIYFWYVVYSVSVIFCNWDNKVNLDLYDWLLIIVYFEN